MLQINWRFCVLFAMMAVVIIMQVVAMKERKIFSLIKALIEDNTKTNIDLKKSMENQTKVLERQTNNLISFEKEMARDNSAILTTLTQANKK